MSLCRAMLVAEAVYLAPSLYRFSRVSPEGGDGPQVRPPRPQASRYGQWRTLALLPLHRRVTGAQLAQ